jgi:hypothetical protein
MRIDWLNSYRFIFSLTHIYFELKRTINKHKLSFECVSNCAANIMKTWKERGNKVLGAHN